MVQLSVILGIGTYRVSFLNLQSILNLSPKKPEFILDIGCGPLARAEIQFGNIYTIVGMDLSKASIQRALAETKLNILNKNVNFIVADAEHLPFKPNIFKTILCIGTICHLPNFIVLMNSLKEIERVSKQDGQIYIPWWRNTLSIGALERDLAIKIMDLIGIPHNQYLKFKSLSQVEQIISNEKLKITSIYYSQVFTFPWLFYNFPQRIQKYLLKIIHILNNKLKGIIWFSRFTSHYTIICQKTDKNLHCNPISFSENLP